jgi:predicted RNA binding protein YcfA (HicA-like mRNA interferase family)
MPEKFESAFRGSLVVTPFRLYAAGLSSADIIKSIRKAGWRLVRVNGSHHHFKHDTRPGLVTVPHPYKDIPLGTMRSIARQADITLP